MKHNLIKYIAPLLAFCLTSCAAPLPTKPHAALPALDAKFGNARATTHGDELTVTSGAISRTWKLTPHGLRTIAIGDPHSTNRVAAASTGADWNAPGWIDESTPAELRSLTARESDDDGFTSRHLEVTAEFAYPAAQTLLRYVIWVYPDAGGLRTQLWLKSNYSANTGSGAADAKPALELIAGNVAGERFTQKSELVLRLGNLDSAKNYSVELGAMDSRPRTQRVEITSLDKETKVVAAESFVVATNQASATANLVTAELTPNLRPDGSVTIRIRATEKDTPAVLSSLRVRSEGKIVAEFLPKTFAKSKPAAPAGGARADFVPVGLVAAGMLPAVEPGFQPGGKNAAMNLTVGKSEAVRISDVSSGRQDATLYGRQGCPPPQLIAIGYYNDTQHRHEPDKHLLRETTTNAPATINWANILCVESAQGGIALVKESHKCVNQLGIDTGAFVAGTNGVAITGWGISRADLRPNEWRWAWANWTIVYPATGADARELAIKQFHRARYPIRADLDLYTKANTWGSGTTGDESKAYASEKEVLAEIDSVAALGLDTLQIDDGWESNQLQPRPPAAQEWWVRPDWYPEGWTNVVARAREKNISLGIWHAANAPLDALKRNYDLAGFKTWKLDFAHLNDYDSVFGYLAKGRGLIDYTGHRIRVNWDVTENDIRFGYFWASECGNLWLANRKPVQPTNVVARPWLMLREAWEVAHYLNLNKVELPIQNFARVNTNVSDAYLYSTTYATALGLPGIPVFFQTTRLFTPEQRAETKALLDIYKQHRAEMFASYIFPIGNEPDNKTWAGFQWFNPEAPASGYVLLFRERLNEQATRSIALRQLAPGTKLTLENLRTGKGAEVTLDANRAAEFTISEPGDVLFLKITQPTASALPK